MKKLLLTIFTLLLTTSLSAQTIHLDINYPITFEKMCETLNLSARQKRLAEKAFSKYCVSIDYANRLKADERKKETVERVNAQHLENMKTFLTKKQYAVYVDMLTVATDKHVALFQETAH